MREPARQTWGARARQDRSKSPRQSLRQALATEQVDPRSLEEAFSTDLGAEGRSKKAPKSDLGRSWLDFGLRKGLLLVLLRDFFARVARLARRRADLCKTPKNLWFFHVFRASAFARTSRQLKKITSENDSSASRATYRLRKILFSTLEPSKWSPRALWGALGGLLGPTWALLGDSWGAPGALLGALGALLGRSWALLGALGALLGRFWAFSVALGPLLDVFLLFWGPPGSISEVDF